MTPFERDSEIDTLIFMNLQDSLREILWNPTMVGSLPKLILSLAIAACLSAILAQAYVHFGHALSNRKSFARNFVMLAVTTTLIISIVKSSLALSLGLVGALSIVRFRAAIKEPEELVFLFLAISIGLGLGAGQALVTIVALVIILGMLVLRGLFYREPAQPNLFLSVASPSSAGLGTTQILDALSKAGATASLKRLDQTSDLTEVSFVVDFKQVSRLEQFTQSIRSLSPAARVTCIEDRGLN